MNENIIHCIDCSGYSLKKSRALDSLLHEKENNELSLSSFPKKRERVAHVVFFMLWPTCLKKS